MQKIILMALLVLSVCAGIALAASPHFLRADASIDSAGDLVAIFKIAGLGDAVTTEVAVTASAAATYGCKTHSGNFPSAANKQQVDGPVSASGDFTSGKNGSITGSLTTAPPATTLTCPHGQSLVVCAVAYDDVTISSDIAGAVVIGDVARTFFPTCL